MVPVCTESAKVGSAPQTHTTPNAVTCWLRSSHASSWITHELDSDVRAVGWLQRACGLEEHPLEGRKSHEAATSLGDQAKASNLSP
jgi:hypothetical protein